MTSLPEINRNQSIVPPALVDEYEDLSRLDTEVLREELTKSLHLTAAQLRRLAVIVRLLEERGEDLSSLKIGLLPYVRQIAYGQVLPDVIVRFGGSPWITKLISRLPLPEQARLANGGKVALAVRRGDEFDHRLVDPLHLDRKQVWQVFAGEQLRSLEEQIVILESRYRAEEPKEPVKRSKIAADHARNGLRVGRQFLPIDAVLAAIAELRISEPETETDEQFDKTVLIKLNAVEHRKLRQRSLDLDVPMSNLVRRAMKAAELI